MKKIAGLFFILILLSVGLYAQVEAHKPYIGIHTSGINLLGGDEPNQWKMWSGGQIGFYFSERIGMELSAGKGWSCPESDSEFNYVTYFTPVSFTLKYNFTKGMKFVPYATLGTGMLYWDLRDVSNEGTEDYSLSEKLGVSVYGNDLKDATIIVGLGFEYYLSRVIGFETGFRYNHLVEQGMDLAGSYGEQFGIAEARLGLNIHFVSAKDTDNDGIKDKYDADPLKAEDIDGFEDEDGVPEDDNDGDGILDVDDLSPNVAEDFDGFEDEDGAPDLDNDGDGILDVNDDCPMEAETINGFQDEDGCPDKKPEIVFETKAPIILDGVNFASGSSELSYDTKNVLGKVVRTLNDYPEMKLEINGYTDNTGSLSFNMKISKHRAESVRNYLINQGIQSDRLTANGYGPENPMTSNSTKEGRAKNRRIEFFRIK
jgi:outer membrane protein OmpA-like peptidoglycan-associated protein